MTRSHIPLPGDAYRLPSMRIVRVLEVLWRDGERVARCEDGGGTVMHLSARFLISHAWRLA